MRFELLGPLRVTVGQAKIALSRRERTLLAILLLHSHQTVSRRRIVDAVWGNRPPADSVGKVHSGIYRLRKRLENSGAPNDLIVTDSVGYQVRVAEGGLDLAEFRRLRDLARAASAGGDLRQARVDYRAGLELWRGPALDGVDSAVIRQAADVLEEERLQTAQECLEVELAQGRAGEVVAELTKLVQQYPLREALHRALMLGLYRAGRQADALTAYRRARQLLHDELGIEPAAELQKLHHAILNRDPSLDPAPVTDAPAAVTADQRPMPRELPAAVAGFTGRGDALEALDRLLGTGSADAGPVVISAIAGTAGVGKTALAVHWARRVADRFPDGQLFIDLRGYAVQPPLRPIEALEALLRSLGVPPEQIPNDEAQAVSLYRSKLAGRRVLIVLDNTRSADQIRPLLPGSRGCFVMVTSRDRLSGLMARDRARRITLDVLLEDEAHALLACILGTKRVQAEPGAIADLARLCGYLPLALRIAAANLADRPVRTIADYVAELTERNRVVALEIESDPESAVRAAFDMSYRSIAADEQRMFRLLALVPGRDFTRAAGAALAETSQADAQRLLDRLAGAHLIEQHVPGRYSFHDLMREYARVCADQYVSRSDAHTAVQRLFDWYLRTTDNAVGQLYPSKFGLARPDWEAASADVLFVASADALTWLNSESPNLIATVSHAATYGPFATAWLLAESLCRFLMFRGHRNGWRAVANSALSAAEMHGSPRSQAAMHYILAQFYLNTNEYTKVEVHASAILSLVRADRWPQCEAEALILLASVFWRRGQLAEAVGPLSRALKIFQWSDDPTSQSVVLSYLGVVEGSLGRLEDSAAHCREALALSRKLGLRNREVLALQNLGVTLHLLGLLEDSREHLESALAMSRELGDRPAEAGTQEALAAIHRDAGRCDKGLELANQALDLSREIGDQRGEAESLNTLASIQLRLGNPEDALHLYQGALDLARASGDVGPQADALLGLAGTYHAHGEFGVALENAQLALDLVRVPGYRVQEGLALAQLAETSFEHGRHEDSLGYAQQALESHRTSGHKLGEARARSLLSKVVHANGDLEAAVGHRTAALNLYLTVGAAPVNGVLPVARGGQEPA